MAHVSSTFLIFLVILVTPAAAAPPDPYLGLHHSKPAGGSRHFSDPLVIDLGQRLFFDRRLSANGTLSCAMCHIPEQGFTQNQLATPVGLMGRAVKRNSPSLLNIGFMENLFHDGREFTLENQVWSPLLSMREMGNPSIGWVLQNIRHLDGYQASFDNLLGGLNVTTLGQALAAYQLSLVAADSPFDRWYYGEDAGALSQDAINGFALFNQHGCSACHLVDEQEALFHDNNFHNTGIGYERSVSPKRGTRVIQLTDTIKIETEEQFEGEIFNDLGRYEVTGIHSDRWKFRTPTLRNIALTSPYMHDGSMASLEEVVRYYMKGGFGSPDQDPRILPFTLEDHEVAQLVIFLNALTSHHIDNLVTTARQTEVGDFTSQN